MHSSQRILLRFGQSLVVREDVLYSSGTWRVRYTPVTLVQDPAVSCAGNWGWELTLKKNKAAFGRYLEIPRQLRGRGLGSWFMVSLIQKGITLGFAHAPVRSLHLIKQQNTPRRNAFYSTLGFDVTLYKDGSGFARVATLGQLRSWHTSRKITAFSLSAAPVRAVSPSATSTLHPLFRQPPLEQQPQPRPSSHR